MGRMDGRVAIVTGGARGMGRAHAVTLAREGASIVLVDMAAQIDSLQYPLSGPADLDDARTLVEAEGAKCLTVQADVRDRAAIDDMVSRTLGEFGHIDVLVANAGIVSYGPALEQSHELFDAIVGTCLTGTWNCCRAVLPHMIERGYGRIAITASGLVSYPMPNVLPYIAAKSGVVGLMKGFALEVIDKGVTVNVVQPYVVSTPALHADASYRLFMPDKKQPTYEDFEATARALSRTGVPWIEAERISRAVLFLVEEEASDITGTIVEIPGGWGHS
jgi:NAD(P)-dependent dehydrogenase (short-subunit alcohol dehydrogenase family)